MGISGPEGFMGQIVCGYVYGEVFFLLRSKNVNVLSKLPGSEILVCRGAKNCNHRFLDVCRT